MIFVLLVEGEFIRFITFHIVVLCHKISKNRGFFVVEMGIL